MIIASLAMQLQHQRQLPVLDWKVLPHTLRATHIANMLFKLTVHFDGLDGFINLCSKLKRCYLTKVFEFPLC